MTAKRKEGLICLDLRVSAADHAITRDLFSLSWVKFVHHLLNSFLPSNFAIQTSNPQQNNNNTASRTA